MSSRSSTLLAFLGFALPSFLSCSNGTTDEPTESAAGTGGAGTGGDVSGGDASGGAAAGGIGGDAGVLDVDPPEGACSGPHGACELVACSPTEEVGLHVEPCAALTPSGNPPTSGTHYGQWANFKVYDEPVPWGFLIHSIEHSGVVLAYNCEEAGSAGLSCDDLQEELVEFHTSWPDDPLCESSPHRLIVVPDPSLDAPFAAAAWGHYLKGSCFDDAAVTEFINAHYGENYENICTPGVDPLVAYDSDCGG